MSTERDEKEDRAMTNMNDARRAHKLLDELDARAELSQEQENLLRSFLPELPKQKTLEELRHEVYDAWIGADGNEWPDDAYGVLETWLAELHAQLQGLKDTPVAVPALPSGLRIADHKDYGRCVVSPGVDDDGTCKIFYLSTHAGDGSDSRWAHIDSLTFIDYESAKPAHPEFLQTEADYLNAPEGTIAAEDTGRPVWKPNEHWSINNNPFDNREMAGARCQVLRWGK